MFTKQEQSFRDLLDEARAKNGGDNVSAEASQKPQLRIDVEAVRRGLDEEFRLHKGRLVDGWKNKISDEQHGLPSRISLSYQAKPGGPDFVTRIDPTGETDSDATQKWSFNVLSHKPDGRVEIGHRFMQMELTVTLTDVRFTLIVGDEPFDEAKMKEIPEDEMRKKIVNSYLTPPKPQPVAKKSPAFGMR